MGIELNLKACPFCGAFPTIEPWHGGSPTKVMIHCSNGEYGDEDGGCSVAPMVTGEDPHEAERRWNRRYLDDLNDGTVPRERELANLYVHLDEEAGR